MIIIFRTTFIEILHNKDIPTVHLMTVLTLAANLDTNPTNLASKSTRGPLLSTLTTAIYYSA